METNDGGPDGSEFTEGLGGWAKVPPEFTEWWNDDVLTPDNPFEPKTAAYWAWEGWQACKAVTLTDPDLRAGIALQLREIERLRAYADAAHWWVEAHDIELLDAGETRHEARKRMLDAEKALLASGHVFKPPNAVVGRQPCCIKTDAEK